MFQTRGNIFIKTILNSLLIRRRRQLLQLQLLLLLLLLLLPLRSNCLETISCDFDISDLTKVKVVHRFQTSCSRGQILWRYPNSGVELTFHDPRYHGDQQLPSIFSGYSITRRNLDEDGDYRFNYVVSKVNTDVKLVRETPGPTFTSIYSESCISSSNMSSHSLKLYAECTPSLSSSLSGKFQLLYMWSEPTPFELCQHCTKERLLRAACTAGNVFTGRIENPRKVERFLTVSVTNITRFDKYKVPKRFCLRRDQSRSDLIASYSQQSFSDHHRCDEVKIHNHGKCSITDFSTEEHINDDFFFIGNTELQRFRLTCVLPIRRFWKLWRSFEKAGETDCFL